VLRGPGSRLHPACSQAACQGVGGARRNDEGLQKGGIPTFINALVNGEVAPIPAVRRVAGEAEGSTQSGPPGRPTGAGSPELEKGVACLLPGGIGVGQIWFR
jgi:hypothetical protein